MKLSELAKRLREERKQAVRRKLTDPELREILIKRLLDETNQNEE